MVKLVVISSAPAAKLDGKPLIDKKFLEGMRFYCEAWPGPVAAHLETQTEAFPFSISVNSEDLPFELHLRPRGEPIPAEALSPQDLVLADGDSHQYLDLPFRPNPPKVVYTIEYIPETRRQIIFLDQHKPLHKKLYSVAWLQNQERRRRRAFKHANGLQANGYPAHKTYQSISANPLLYLDNRVGKNLVASEADMAARHQNLTSNAPLRLIHSGRLEPMKGAQDLIPIARRLAGLGVDFTLDIFGTGSLAEGILSKISAHNMARYVRLHAPVDFETELVPFTRSHADLFLSCHRQSDPSCTYLESMGCGVPIAGYGNRMWGALVETSGAGWVVPLGDWRGLADRIAALAQAREEIEAKADAALSFAKNHLFEHEFDRRIEHLSGLV